MSQEEIDAICEHYTAQIAIAKADFADTATHALHDNIIRAVRVAIITSLDDAVAESLPRVAETFDAVESTINDMLDEVRTLVRRIKRPPPPKPLPPPADGPVFVWQVRPARAATYPIVYTDIWESYRTLEKSHWLAGDVNMTQDSTDWNSRDLLTDAEKHFTRTVLGFFSHADAEVADVIAKRIMPLYEMCPEASAFEAAKLAQERVHDEAYNRQAIAVASAAELATIRAAFNEHSATHAMGQWCRAIASGPPGEAVFCMALVEGVMFSGEFCGLHRLRKIPALPGITTNNEYIMRDENLHTTKGCADVREHMLPEARPTQARAAELTRQAVAIACDFARAALSQGDMRGLSTSGILAYIRFTGNVVMDLCGYEPLQPPVNPLDFMADSALQPRVDFFNRRPTQYQREAEYDSTKALTIAQVSRPLLDD